MNGLPPSYDKAGAITMESDYVEVQYSLMGGLNMCNKFEYQLFAEKGFLNVLTGQIKSIYPDAKIEPAKDEEERIKIRNGDGAKISRIQIFRLLAKHGYQLRCCTTRGYDDSSCQQPAEKWTFVK